MKKSTFLLVPLLTLILFSCQKNPFSEVDKGNWNNERSILDIKLANQVGKATITRIDSSRGSVALAINVAAVPDLSKIKIVQLQLSYGDKSSKSVGDDLSFDNASQSATITVTSPTGKSRVYTITASSFRETLVGTWDITGLTLYGGTGPEYGGGAVLKLTDKPWDWPADDGPQAELDNVLTFKMTGITDDGNTYGTVTNDAGPDGLYADFLFIGKPQTDVNHFYRKIPEGKGTWLRNYATGLITFTFADSSTTSGSFVGPGTVDLGNGLSETTTDNAIEFDLNGTDDWDNIYSDYDKFVERPRKFWIDIKKQK